MSKWVKSGAVSVTQMPSPLMLRNTKPLKPVPRGKCPCPRKSVYASKTAAEAGLKYALAYNKIRNTCVANRVYQCDPGCGWWHLTSMPEAAFKSLRPRLLSG